MQKAIGLQLSSSFSPRRKGACTPFKANRRHSAVCRKRQTYEDYKRSQGDSGVRDESGRRENRQRAPEETGRGAPTTSCPPAINPHTVNNSHAFSFPEKAWLREALHATNREQKATGLPVPVPCGHRSCPVLGSR